MKYSGKTSQLYLILFIKKIQTTKTLNINFNSFNNNKLRFRIYFLFNIGIKINKLFQNHLFFNHITFFINT